MPIIQFNLMEGRTVTQKRRLVKKVTEAVCEALDVEASTVRILLHEVTGNDFAAAGITAAEKLEIKKAENLTEKS
tara:strand:+ start:1410 stop:1634 length:225 start_codon:yes stop_codon:yes gene_type:complete